MLNTLNEQLFFFINGAAGTMGMLDQFFIFVNAYVVPVLLILTLVWFFFVLPRRAVSSRDIFAAYRTACIAALAVGAVWVVTELIKGSIAFPRPVELLQGVRLFAVYGSYDSFPSAHTAFSFAAATLIYQQHRSTGIMVYFIAFLVGISRIYVGVHFPLDVIVGALIGMFVPLGLIALFKRYKF